MRKVVRRRVYSNSTPRRLSRKVYGATATGWFNKYYDEISDIEFDNLTGGAALAEDTDSGLTHVAFIAAKPEYEEALANNGLEVLEVASDGGRNIAGFVMGSPMGDIFMEVTDKDVQHQIFYFNY